MLEFRQYEKGLDVKDPTLLHSAPSRISLTRRRLPIISAIAEIHPLHFPAVLASPSTRLLSAPMATQIRSCKKWMEVFQEVSRT